VSTTSFSLASTYESKVASPRYLIFPGTMHPPCTPGAQISTIFLLWDLLYYSL